ncbi:FG-GAP repeat domain-containing protein [Benzoatithermus flavus]|uniref:VCBS repeat-containing protein n=1 Tax=Benzoatithermus flavus TaxID=3108223 RepID=A0ABU8XSM4_9PROT
MAWLVAALATSAQAQLLVARDIAASAGLSYFGQPDGQTEGESVVFDYDQDGDLDILLSAHGMKEWPLFQNRGDGSFVQVLAGTFPRQDRHGCVAADFGSTGSSKLPDGLIDLYCVVGACQGTCKTNYPNELYLQTPDHRFVKVPDAWGAADPHGRGREAAVLDFDRDGLPDIVVANEVPSIFPTPNRLYRNLGGRFQEVVDPAVTRELGSVCVEPGDIDGDGWTDLLFCSKSGVVTLKNVRGRFQDTSASTPYRKTSAIQLELADVDGDGRLDLLQVAQTLFTIRLNANGAFPKASFTWPLQQGRDVAVGDVDLDGVLDIYLVQGQNERYGDVMLLGNGGGKSFRTTPIPQARVGEGDVATAVSNWNGTGRTAFLVTNGRWGEPGPVQLVTFSNR